MVAVNVTGGSAKQADNGALIIMNGTGVHEATVKSFSPQNGYGFIEWNGTDLFFVGKNCKGSYPAKGDTVKFDIEDSPVKPGTPHAVNITGGSRAIFGKDDKGKGKGGPYG